MAWSEDQIICIKHPKEIPQPGVCPSCLRERLSRITAGQHSRTSTVILSSSSFCSSGSNSPLMNRGMHQRVASDVLDSIYLAMKGYDLGLKKSRSVAFPSGDVDHGVVRDCRVVHSNNKKKKKGFWGKVLLRSSVRKTKI